MLKKKMIAALMALFILAGAGTAVAAYAESETNLEIVGGTLQSIDMKAGESKNCYVELALKEGHSIDPEFDVMKQENAPFTIKDIKVQSKENRNSSTLFWDEDTTVILSYTIETDKYAKIGEYSYMITYTDVLLEDEDFSIPRPGYLMMKVSIVDEKTPPLLSVISSTEFFCKAGDVVSMSLTLTNLGELQAMNTYVSANYELYDDVLIPAYIPLQQKLGNISAGEARTVDLSYKVAEEAGTRRIKLPINLTYKTATGEDASATAYVYIYVEGKPEPTPTPTPTPTATPTPTPTATPTPSPIPEVTLLLLNNVKQSPSQPMAGEKVTVSFYLENAGNVDVKNIKVSVAGLSAMGFEPISAEPYQYFTDIKAGAKQKVELTLRVGEDIPEGLNPVSVQYSYDIDSRYGLSSGAESVTLYVLDVQNPEEKEEEVVVSRPKLMVSDFYTDVEEVKAGNVFDFTFELMNTNDSIAAKNIKVTVTGASNAFSVTSGGNSFFISEIKPQEKTPITINLKASAAATTGAYPIQIRMEYEYEGMVSTGSYSGEVVEEEILLQVKENLRPSVENVYVGSWETPMINQPTTMSFEFYNMGKSTLNNTYVTVEGDFMLSNGSNTYYIGNIAAGMPEYIEFDVVPLVEGDAVGKMVIHMEDSNGDEVTMEKEFTAYVMGEMSWEDPGYMDPGYMDPGYMDPGYMDPSMPVDGNATEKPIVPLWIFLCIQAGILVIVIPLVRAIRLSAYRRKIKREDAI